MSFFGSQELHQVVFRMLVLGGVQVDAGYFIRCSGGETYSLFTAATAHAYDDSTRRVMRDRETIGSQGVINLFKLLIKIAVVTIRSFKLLSAVLETSAANFRVFVWYLQMIFWWTVTPYGEGAKYGLLVLWLW
ncbi:Hypothetical predicted protein [Olea europaea subsp. europaea]|uniref:Uncharacterized protein n=1 Tax=Olea europaea subsp. europaea TaxID=158383 RepID=A0A8S0RPJ3_OLEEU|nr:Hypothetical predicted protein [Olea europaea subsp. europaea]